MIQCCRSCCKVMYQSIYILKFIIGKIAKTLALLETIIASKEIGYTNILVLGLWQGVSELFVKSPLYSQYGKLQYAAVLVQFIWNNSRFLNESESLTVFLNSQETFFFSVGCLTHFPQKIYGSFSCLPESSVFYHTELQILLEGSLQHGVAGSSRGFLGTLCRQGTIKYCRKLWKVVCYIAACI